MTFTIKLAKSVARKLQVEEPARRIWRKSLRVFGKAGKKKPQTKVAPEGNDKSRFVVTDKGLIMNCDRANLLIRALSLPPDDVNRLRIAKHLFRLKNFVAAARVVDPVDIKKLVTRDLFFVAKVKLYAHKGVESDQLLAWFIRQSLISSLSENDYISLAEWVFNSGTDLHIKRRRLVELRHSIDNLSGASDKVRRHVRFLEFRVDLAIGDGADVLVNAELDQLDPDAPDFQLRFVPHLKALGYINEARNLLTRLLDYCGMQHYGVVLAALRFDPRWPGIDVYQLPEDYLARNEVLQIAHDCRNVGEDFDYLFKASVESHMRYYSASDIYGKDKILRMLLRVDLVSEIEKLLSADGWLPDTVLPMHCAIGLRYFMEDDFLAARDRFMRVLEEDPSDPIASQGMRLVLPRAGGDMNSIVRLRDKIGYGIGGYGRVGNRKDVGSEKTISLLMSGRYIEGLYSKRNAEHWRLLKGFYGKRFLNFETIPLRNSKSKSLFVIGDEGVGDEVRTAQFYAFLADNFGEVVVSCDPRLTGLLKRSFPSISFVPVERYRKGLVEKIGETNDRITGMNLKLSHYLTEECKSLMDGSDFITFGQTLFFNYFNGVIPRLKGGAYFVSQANAFADHNDRSRKLRVGILWRSHFQSMWRKFMYLKIEDFMPLLEVEGIELWSVQHKMNQGEHSFCKEHGIHLIEDIDLFNDFEGLASYLKGMDVVVGISSLPAELAAAVGTPVWMLGFSPENYFLRTAGGETEEDQLTLNSKVIAPGCIDFTAPAESCIGLVMRETCDRLTALSEL